MSRSRAPLPLWRVKRGNSAVSCLLKQAAGDAFLLSVTINDDEIAARRYRTKEAAVGAAGVLLEHLATDGWTVVVGVPERCLTK